MPFSFKVLFPGGPVVVVARSFGDKRGRFLELYRRSDFVAGGILDEFVQDNWSTSTAGVLRGLHYQKSPRAQGKLVRCARGRIYDVAVDIRKGSPTYGRWWSEELTADNNTMFYVPAGFAHGFYVLSDGADVLYKCTDEYSPENDRGIIWNDPDISISWPTASPLLSEKDAAHPQLRAADSNYEYCS